MLIKQVWGIYLAIGGHKQEIYERWLSLFNWNGLNGEIIWLSDEFGYFLITEPDYLKTRCLAFCNNWEKFWPVKTNNGKFMWKRALNKAKKELENIKFENFLSNYQFVDNYFTIGYLPNDLEKVNCKILAGKEKIFIDKDITLKVT